MITFLLEIIHIPQDLLRTFYDSQQNLALLRKHACLPIKYINIITLRQ